MCGRVLMLYVDRSSQHWVVRDADGNLWQLPQVDDGWAFREPFDLTGETRLEAVPGHYRYMLGLPTSSSWRKGVSYDGGTQTA